MTAAQRLAAEVRTETKAEILLRLLGQRFGVLPEAIRERVLHASSERLDVWVDRVITAQNLDNVFI